MSIASRLQPHLSRLLSLHRALFLVWESTPQWTLVSILLLFVQSVLPLLSLYLTKLIVDTVSELSPPESFQPVIGLIILAAIVTFVGDLCRSLTGFVSEAQSQIVTDYVQNLLHAKSIEVDLEYYENAQYYDALHQAQDEAPYRPTIILKRLIQTGQSAISLVAIAVLLFSLHWFITAILVLAVLPLFFVRLKYAKRLYRRWRKWTPQQRRADYFHQLLIHESYAKEIRLFNLGGLFQQQFHQLRQHIRQDRINLSRNRSLAEALTQGNSNLAVFVVFGFIAYQTFQGEITVGSLVMYYQAFQRGQRLLQDMLQSLASLYENSLFLSNFYQFLELKPTVLEPLHPRKTPQSEWETLEFHQVQFRYSHSTRPVLEEINLTIQRGETIALVGENGAGKTTLIKLLCRLYDPTEGKITWDGIDLKDFQTLDLRREISVVFQDYVHYDLTVRENIGFGNLDWVNHNERIEAAAQASGADKAISRLPHGYETILGHQFEDGEELSIGEWQKIAIARAFLRQAQIIVLDEPTSALDPKAEAEVLSQFRQLTRDRTAILISHRLSSIKLADRIFVLEDGKISEQGNHQELMQLGGTYANLFETQARNYR